jgi:hypothetical protein
MRGCRKRLLRYCLQWIWSALPEEPAAQTAVTVPIGELHAIGIHVIPWTTNDPKENAVRSSPLLAAILVQPSAVFEPLYGTTLVNTSLVLTGRAVEEVSAADARSGKKP